MKRHTFLTPPQVAERMGVKPSKVIGWIRAGELEAINAASSMAKQPRFRISLKALEQFEKNRTVSPPPKQQRTKHLREKPSDFIEYF
jgi:hypothetical protein